MPDPPRICLTRHFETEKNLQGIHGESALDALTPIGKKQALHAAQRLGSMRPFSAVSYTPTPQAAESARELAGLLELPLEPPLSLSPSRLGAASGLSQEELRSKDPASAVSLELFRNRVIDATKLAVREAEPAVDLEERLATWWEGEGRRVCPNRVVVGSTSTILMLTHLLEGVLPTSGQYYNYGIPNGALRVWQGSSGRWTTSPPLLRSQWPRAEGACMGSARGQIQYTRFFPGWDPNGVCCILIPSHLANSRCGDSGFYTELARHLALLGCSVLTVDTVGCGESTPIARTLENDVLSVRTVINAVVARSEVKRIVAIGHCASGAAAAALCEVEKGLDGIVLLLGDWGQRERSSLESKHLGEMSCRACLDRSSGQEYLPSALETWERCSRNISGIVLSKGVECALRLEVPEAASIQLVENCQDPRDTETEVVRSLVALGKGSRRQGILGLPPAC